MIIIEIKIEYLGFGESGLSFRHRLGELIDALEEEVFCDYVTEMSLRHRQCVNKSAIK